MRLTPERVRGLLAVEGMFGSVLLDVALVRDLAADLLDARDELARLTRERDEARAALRDASRVTREMLDALEAPAPVWDADESEHDEHAARLTAALDASRALLAGGES